jgi:hypothetical protein
MMIRPDSALRRRPRSQERGTILVVAVLIVFLMMVIVTDTSLVARVEWEATANSDIDLKLEYAVRGGYEIAKAYLVDDEENAGDIDTLLEEWSAPEGIQREFNPEGAGGGSSSPMAGGGGGEGGQENWPKVTILIEDEERKWPLPLLMVGADTQKDRRKQGLANVLDGFRKGTPLDLDPGTASNYADLIFNFVTRKENDSGFGPTPRPATKSGCLLDVTDLALLPGLPAAVLFDQVDDESGRIVPGLINSLTLWSDMVINVNTASEAVLRGLFRRDEEETNVGSEIYNHREQKSDEWLTKENLKGLSAAERRQREKEKEKLKSTSAPTPAPGGRPGGAASPGEEGEDGGVYQKVEDVKKASTTVTDRIYNEINSLLTVKSNVFTIWVEAEMLGVRKIRRYVVRRNGPAFILILSAQVNWPRYHELSPDEQASGR